VQRPFLLGKTRDRVEGFRSVVGTCLICEAKAIFFDAGSVGDAVDAGEGAVVGVGGRWFTCDLGAVVKERYDVCFAMLVLIGVVVAIACG
jgi:hypothetical protein